MLFEEAANESAHIFVVFVSTCFDVSFSLALLAPFAEVVFPYAGLASSLVVFVI